MISIDEVRDIYNALFSMKGETTKTPEEIRDMPFDEWRKWAAAQMNKSREDGR